MRRISTDLLVLAVFALAALVFYWPALVGGLVLLPLDNLWDMLPWVGPSGAIPHNQLIGDMILQNYPWKIILEQAWRQHELPLWNPYEMVGLPYLATGQTSALYPFTALFLLLGPLRAYAWYSALHQFLAASLTYLLLRRLGAGRFGAMVAGLVFAFCFFLTVSYIWPMVLGAAIWLPLAIWSLVGLARAMEKGSLGLAVAVDLPVGALAIALGVLGGHLEITFYATFVVGLYALYQAVRFFLHRSREACGRFLIAAGLVVGLGVLVGAVQLAPFLDVLQSNNRQGETTYRQVISYALPHHQILGFLMPDFFGNPTAHHYFDLTTFRETLVGNDALGQPTDPPHTIFWGTKNYVEAGGYVGVVPLLLALVGAFSSRSRDRWFFVGVAVLSLLLAFGTPLYALIYYGLPFFSQLRTPFRWLYPFDFSIAVLAGLGADWLWRCAAVPAPLPPPAEGASGRRGDVAMSPPPRLSVSPRPRVFTSLLWLPAIAGLTGLTTLALSLLERSRSVAFAGRVLAHRADLQRAFGSGAMLYSYEFRNLAIFFGLLTLGGVLMASLAMTRSGGRGLGIRVWAAQAGGDRVPDPKPSPLHPAPVREVIAALLVATIVGDLFFFGTHFVSEAPASILNQRVDLGAVLHPDPAGPRFATLDSQVLQPNLGVILGVPGVAGYDTIIPTRFVRLWSLVEPPGDLPYNKIGILHHPESLSNKILDLLGVRYVLTTTPIDIPAVRLIGQFGAIRVYERPTALPRAFVVEQVRWVPDANAAFDLMKRPDFDPSREVVLEGNPEGGDAETGGGGEIAAFPPRRVALSAGGGSGAVARSPSRPLAVSVGDGGAGKATITSYRLDRVTIEVDATGPAWLVLTDGSDPGWQATVDGVAAPVMTADGDLRAVYLPPTKPSAGTPQGEKYQIVFWYSPLSLRVGAYVSFLALTVLALVASWPLWRRLIGHYAGQAERVLRNTTLPMFTSFLNKGVDFGFAALMLRILGPGEIGAYTLAIALMGYFEIFTNFGLNALVVREVSRNRDLSSRYIADAIALRLGLCALATPFAAGIILAGQSLLGMETHAIAAFALLALAVVPGNLSATLTAIFNAWERTEVPAALSVAVNLVRVTLGVAALLTGAGIVGLAAIALLLNVVQVVVFTIVARRALRLSLTGPVRDDFPMMMNESLPLLINHVLVTVFFKIDVPLLYSFKGADAVGYYSTAYKWLDGFLIVPSTFTFAVYPALSRFAQQTGDGLRTAYEISARILLTVGIPIALAVFFLSGDLILLLGGQAYYPESARALAILICFLPFSYLNGVTQYTLIAVKRQRFITLAFVLSATFNVVANLLLIPRYSFYAASAITVVSEIVLMVPFLYAVRQSIGRINWLQTAGKPVVAGALMAVVAWAGGRIEPHLALLVGVTVYLGVVWALRVFSPQEVGILRGIVGGLRKRANAMAPAEA